MSQKHVFSSQDLKQMRALGLTRKNVESQLAVYAQGRRLLKLNRPCSPGDGILSLSRAERSKLSARFENEANKFKLLKFVPASGAASRMFAKWFTAAREGGFGSPEADRAFLNDLKKMPFFPVLKENASGTRDLRHQNIPGLLNYILNPQGLHYGWLPKALIPFHAYPDGKYRTALEEHLVEAASYLGDRRGRCRLHFTFSQEHVRKAKAALKDQKSACERLFNIRLLVGHSVQSPDTNIVAADHTGNPFRDEDGRLVFRPGGHGALLKNLSGLRADFIFVKNIDNIVPENFLKKILPYKKMLGGLALDIREMIFAILRHLDKGGASPAVLNAYADKCRRIFHNAFPSDFDSLTPAAKKKSLRAFLNRPLRVCGMVQNDGEPGGGPFWVDEPDGSQTLQIVESAHVDFANPSQGALWKKATHFNPVDLVCCITNYKGEKFDLSRFVDPNACLISEKTEKGKKLLAQELPGLWNGSMSRWNTVFVELPLAVFNPVKTVDDLLRPSHTAGRKMRAR